MECILYDTNEHFPSKKKTIFIEQQYIKLAFLLKKKSILTFLAKSFCVFNILFITHWESEDDHHCTWIINNRGEWLLFMAKWAIFQLYHGENKLPFDEMMFVLDQCNKLDLYSTSSLKQQFLGRHSTRTHYPDSEPRLYLPLLVKAVCSKCPNTNFTLWFEPTSHPWSTTLKHYTTDMIYLK